MLCIGRVLSGGEGPLVFGEVFFLRSIVMPVGVAVVFNGTYSDVAVVFLLNFSFK